MPEASGRPAVRATMRSMSRSHRSFTTQPAARITRRADREQHDQPQRLARRRRGQQDPPQPGQEQQPDPDRAIDARQQQVGQPRSRQPRHPAGRDDVGVRLHGCYSARRHDRVNPPLTSPRRWPKAAPSPQPRRRRTTWGRHAPGRRATRCCCSTAATANSAPASRPSGATAPASRSSTGLRAADAGTRSLAGVRAAEARRHRPCGAEGDRTRRRRAAAGPHRAQQHASDQRGSACRHRDRGRRAVRAPDRAAAACAAAARGPAVRLAAGPPPVRRHRAQQRAAHRPGRRSRARCWSAPKAASRRRNLTRCGRIPL